MALAIGAVGLTATVVAVLCTLVPSPDAKDQMGEMLKLVFASAVLIFSGVAFYAAAKWRAGARAKASRERLLATATAAAPDQSLPAWLYTDPRLLRRWSASGCSAQAWQIVCHVNDIPEAGDYQTLDFLDEKVVTLRGDDGAVRSFHNVCRHRASRLADGD